MYKHAHVQLQEFVRVVQAEHVKEDLIPMFHNLASDEQVRVKYRMYHVPCSFYVHVCIHVCDRDIWDGGTNCFYMCMYMYM